jgi:hypothetical protein
MTMKQRTTAITLILAASALGACTNITPAQQATNGADTSAQTMARDKQDAIEASGDNVATSNGTDRGNNGDRGNNCDRSSNATR